MSTVERLNANIITGIKTTDVRVGKENPLSVVGGNVYPLPPKIEVNTKGFNSGLKLVGRNVLRFPGEIGDPIEKKANPEEGDPKEANPGERQIEIVNEENDGEGNTGNTGNTGNSEKNTGNSEENTGNSEENTGNSEENTETPEQKKRRERLVERVDRSLRRSSSYDSTGPYTH